MATRHKTLSVAKAAAARTNIDTLLRDTDHDDRLNDTDRAHLEHAALICLRLERQLRTDTTHPATTDS
jgi:hypothetical protein